MWKLIYKDIMLSKKVLITMIIFAIVFPLINYSSNSSFNSSMGSLLVVGFTFFIIAMEIEERDKSYRIIHSLPVTRKESVLARYVGSLVISALSMVIVSIIFLILSSFIGNIYILIDYKYMMNSIAAIISISSITMAVAYLFGYRAARISNFIALFSIFIIFTGTLSDSSNEVLVNLLSFVNNVTAPVLSIKFVIAALIYLLSMILSISMYEHRDL